LNMEKNEIYDHLAQIYLDTPLKRKRPMPRIYTNIFKRLFFISLAGIIILSIILFYALHSHRIATTQTTLGFSSGITKIDFNLDSAKTQSFIVNLNNLDVAKFKNLSFSLRKQNSKDTVSIRVELTNAFKEKSEVYINNIPSSWKDYKIKLSDFNKISDWSQMESLSFIIEEWNTRENSGSIYIDNITLSM